MTQVDPRDQIDGNSFSTQDSFSRALLYLHLSGRMTPGHADLFTRYLDRPRPQTAQSRVFEWSELARASGGNDNYVSTRKAIVRQETRNGAPVTERFTIENCLNDAFATAIDTLVDRRNRYGQESPEFRRWLEGQQQVFANCASPSPMLPSPPEAGWSELERQDRMYQIAASLFYSLDYDRAAEAFRAIAADSASPWAAISRYLVARSQLRNGLNNSNDTGSDLRAALALYREMAAEPALVAQFPSIVGMIRMIEIRLDTPQFMRDLERELLERPTAIDVFALEDFFFLLQQGGAARVAVADEGDLLRFERLATDTSANAPQRIFESWQDTRNPAWLYLAVHRRSGMNGAPHSMLLADVLALDAGTPGRADMLVRAVELVSEGGERDRARELATSALSDLNAGLEPRHRNRLQQVVARSIDDPYERLAASLMHPVAIRADSGFRRTDPEALRQATRGAALLTDESVNLINREFTPAMLLEAAERVELDAYLRGRFLISAWVKAVLLGDGDLARRAAPLLAREFPDLAQDLDRFVTGPDSAFTAARIIVEHPGFSPLLPTGIGRYRSVAGPDLVFPSARVALGLRNYNWWCDGGATALPGATEFFGPAILEHARAEPEDERVPYALHRLVFATRYACSKGPGEISQAAFALLHRNYPDSEWAAQTPYWFE